MIIITNINVSSITHTKDKHTGRRKQHKHIIKHDSLQTTTNNKQEQQHEQTKAVTKATITMAALQTPALMHKKKKKFKRCQSLCMEKKVIKGTTQTNKQTKYTASMDYNRLRYLR